MKNKYILIVVSIISIPNFNTISAMNWWPSSLSWSGSSSAPQLNNNNNNNQLTQKIKPIIATATKYAQEYNKRLETYFHLNKKNMIYASGIIIGLGEHSNYVKKIILETISQQDWEDEQKHTCNIENAFNIANKMFNEQPELDHSQGVSVTLVILLKSKFIIAHAGVAGFILKRDTYDLIFSIQHNICLNTNERTRLNNLQAPVQKLYLGRFLGPIKITHNHNEDNETIYYPAWEYLSVYDDYDSSLQDLSKHGDYDSCLRKAPIGHKENCTNNTFDVFLLYEKPPQKDPTIHESLKFAMISRGIGYSLFNPYITCVPEIFSYDHDNKEEFLLIVGPNILDLVEPATLCVMVEQELRQIGESPQTVTSDQAFEITRSIIARLADINPDIELTLIIIFFSM